ncbi:MAG: hypothetical protein DRN47_00570 [Candidatus Wolframiiraptor sp.]|nr:MAG: hypothetical protein DRN47_00570 [Candidatus Wolframiiraptor sp.]
MASRKGRCNQKTRFGEYLTYDVPAEGYDELYGKEQYEKYELVSMALRDRFRKFRVIADVGCATGLFGEYLKSIDFDGLYIGIDLSEERLKAAKHKAHASWILIQADAEHLPLRRNSVDLVACITVIHLLDIRNAMKEFVRVSRDAIVVTLLKKRLDLEYEILKNLNRFPGLSVKRVTMPKVKDEIFIAYKTIPEVIQPHNQ